MIRLLALVLALLPTLGVHAEQAAANAPPGLHTAEPSGGAFASIDEVASRLAAADPGLTVLHVGHGARGYDLGHVPGSHFVGPDDWMAPRAERVRGLLDVGAAHAMFRRLGLTGASDVVLVGDASGVFPALLRLELHRLGVRARLLDGHVRGWAAAGHPLSANTPPAPAPSALEPRAVRRVGVDHAAAEDAAAEGRLIDVRGVRQFSGERPGPGTRRAGRVPGARSLPWQRFFTGVNPPLLRPRAGLIRLLAEAGIEPGSPGPIVLYDSIGTQVALAQAVFEDLGIEAIVLTGGYAGWAEAGLPVDAAPD